MITHLVKETIFCLYADLPIISLEGTWNELAVKSVYITIF